MTSKANIQADLNDYMQLYRQAQHDASTAQSAQYEAERAHHQQINQIIDVLGLRNTYRMSKHTDGTLDVTGVDSFLADIQAAANAIQSVEAQKRLGIYQVFTEED